MKAYVGQTRATELLRKMAGFVAALQGRQEAA